MPTIVAFPLLLFLVRHGLSSLPSPAQGCINSPEGPTAVLAFVGCTAVLWMHRMRR